MCRNEAMAFALHSLALRKDLRFNLRRRLVFNLRRILLPFSLLYYNASAG
jgi:hypothetical protein